MRTLHALVVAVLAGGCGGGHDTHDGGADGATPSNVYVPFSPSNLQAQQARVGIYEELVAARKAMGFDKTKCGDVAAPAAGTLAEIYTRNDAIGGVLRDKVKGRVDDHGYNQGAKIGMAMDEIITRALADCSAGKLDPVPAGQLVEKTLQWFFYASVYHELTLGQKVDGESPAKWDEAFGYYGRSADGATSRGISGTAKKRDENFKTTLNDAIYRGFIDGRGHVAAKHGSGVAEVATKIDNNLLAVFALSTAREFALIPGAQGAQAAEFLAEGIGFFNVIEPAMKQTAAADAKFVRDELAKADYAKPTAIDNPGIVTRIEKAFGVDATP
jgi:hypothetical protein